MNNNQNSYLKLYLQRIAIVIFWLVITAGFLYSPYLSKFFSPRRTLNIYTWADMLDVDSLLDFEKKTGIKVNLSYYDNTEELRTKLKISNGRGYDLFVLTDYSVRSLVKLDILQPVDKKKLDFLGALEPRLLHKLEPLDKKYLVPMYWDIYGIGINLNKFNQQMPDPSWSVVFDEKVLLPNIGMIDDALEASAIASQYLYGKLKKLDKGQLKIVKELLMSQKKNIESYTDLRGDYLLMSGSSPAVVSQGAYIFRAMQEDENIKFLLPKEGSFISFDGIAIAKNTTKQDDVYKFINFMFKKQVVEKFVEEFEFLPVRKDVLDEIDLDYIGGKERFLKPECLDNLEFFKYIAPREKIGKLWIEVKAS